MSVLHSKRHILLAIVLLATLAISPAALAHEGREVGELNFVVGFAEEPALEGQPNAVFLRVTAKGATTRRGITTTRRTRTRGMKVRDMRMKVMPTSLMKTPTTPRSPRTVK